MSCGPAPSVAASSQRSINDTTVKYTCLSGYSLQGEQYVYCSGGVWGTNLPQCLIIYENHQVQNAINVYETVTLAEIPNWLLLLIAGTAGIAALSFLVGLLLCCLHLCGCYSGPVVGFGGNHVYPEKKCCDCDVCCCCCCRCFRRCGEDEEDEEEDMANTFYVGVDQVPPQAPPPPDSPDHSKENSKPAPVETTALLNEESEKKATKKTKKKGDNPSNTEKKTDNSEESQNDDVKIDIAIDEILDNTEGEALENKKSDSPKTKKPSAENNLPGEVPSENKTDGAKPEAEDTGNKVAKKSGAVKKPSEDILAALDVKTQDEGEKSPKTKQKAAKIKDGAKQKLILGD